MVKDPRSKPSAINLYAASVQWRPSQLTCNDGSSHVLDPLDPHMAMWSTLYGPPLPQHAIRAPFVNPATSLINHCIHYSAYIHIWVVSRKNRSTRIYHILLGIGKTALQHCSSLHRLCWCLGSVFGWSQVMSELWSSLLWWRASLFSHLRQPVLGSCNVWSEVMK